MPPFPQKELEFIKNFCFITFDGYQSVEKQKVPGTFSGTLSKKFTKRSQVSKYETRRANDLQIPRPRLEITKKSFSYKGANVLNDIPNNIRNVEPTALFKSRLETIFLGQ